MKKYSLFLLIAIISYAMASAQVTVTADNFQPAPIQPTNSGFWVRVASYVVTTDQSVVADLEFELDGQSVANLAPDSVRIIGQNILLEADSIQSNSWTHSFSFSAVVLDSGVTHLVQWAKVSCGNTAAWAPDTMRLFYPSVEIDYGNGVANAQDTFFRVKTCQPLATDITDSDAIVFTGVYPNPATTTEINFSLGFCGIFKIYDSQGKEVSSGEVFYGQNKISIANLADGIYFIVLNGSNAGTPPLYDPASGSGPGFYRQKFVVAHR
jgi:hypothetical protein